MGDETDEIMTEAMRLHGLTKRGREVEAVVIALRIARQSDKAIADMIEMNVSALAEWRAQDGGRENGAEGGGFSGAILEIPSEV